MFYSFPSSNLIWSHILLEILGSLCSPRTKEDSSRVQGRSLYAVLYLQKSLPGRTDRIPVITFESIGLCLVNYGIYNLEEALRFPISRVLFHRWENWNPEKGRDILWVPSGWIWHDHWNSLLVSTLKWTPHYWSSWGQQWRSLLIPENQREPLVKRNGD